MFKQHVEWNKAGFALEAWLFPCTLGGAFVFQTAQAWVQRDNFAMWAMVAVLGIAGFFASRFVLRVEHRLDVLGTDVGEIKTSIASIEQLHKLCPYASGTAR